MMQQEKATVTTEAAKKGKIQNATASTPIRIKIQSKGKLDALLARVNRDRIGRKVKADDLVCFSLDLLTDAHLDEISTKLMTNKERVEILYRKLAKARRGLTKDDFLGMLLEGKLPV